jgi:UDP-glucose:(heptosyl)LPS alpha-1,3-glucosyltransferase
MDAFDPGGGGAERWSAQLHAHLRDAGHEVHVLAFAAPDPAAVENLHLLPDPGGVIGRARAIEAALARLPPMAVHDSGTGWSADVFHPQTGSRLLSMDRVIAAEAPGRRLRLALSPHMWRLRRDMARVEHRGATQARRVVAVSARIAALLARRHALPPGRIARIPNGVETARFAPARLTPLRAAAREGLGAGDNLVLLLVAHNLRLKGCDIALRALAAARAQGVAARLVVAGGAPDAGWQGLVAALGAAPFVTFAGNVPAIEPLLAAADVLVHPTRWDACSLCTIEAMAAGLPVVTSAANGAADLIADGVDGFVLPDAEDHGRLAAHIAALADPALRARIGAAALRASAAADIAANCRAVEDLLAEAWRARHGASP